LARSQGDNSREGWLRDFTLASRTTQKACSASENSPSNTLKQNPKVSPQVALTQFGKKKVQPVVPALSQLHEAIFERVDLFAGLV
jgi:hypothetical protein